MTHPALYRFGIRLLGVAATAALLALLVRGGAAWPLGFFVLVPWLLVLDRETAWHGALASALLMAVAYMAAGFAWFGAAIGDYIGIGAGPGMGLLVALGPLLQPQLLAFALVRHGVRRSGKPTLAALAGAAAWVGCEWLLPKLLGDTLGHGLGPSLLMRQAADLGGAAGLTVLLLLCAEALAAAWHRAQRAGPRTALRPLAIAMAIPLALAGYGAIRLTQLPPAPAGGVPALRVAMVQSGIVRYEQLREEMGGYGVVRHVLDTHYALSVSALREHGADALLWSETVYPTTFGTPKSEDGAALDAEILAFVEAVGVPLLFGTFDRDASGEYNAAALVQPGQGLVGRYRKTHPFPLTEYVPTWLDRPWLRRLLPWAGGWQPGDGARVLPLRSRDGREVNVLPLICLDDVRTRLALQGARLGAQAIVGLSNDSWFTDHPIGARLHLQVATFRSVETRLPQLRLTSNGLSAVVDARGQILVSTGMGDQAVLTGVVHAQDPPPTLLVRWGDWVGPAALAFLAALAAFALWHGAASRRASQPAARDTSAWSMPVQVMPQAMRMLAALLQLAAGAGLLWLAAGMLREGLGVHSLRPVWQFAATVLAPWLAAAALLRAHAGHASVHGDTLVLDLPTQRQALPLAGIAALHAWRTPLPSHGLDLVLATGNRWPHGIATADPRTFADALAKAGAKARLVPDGPRSAAAYAALRATTRRRGYEHPLFKFALFPLLMALVAFRMHQVIAFGGTFGEWQVHGPGAWLLGLLIWWAAWVIGLVLFATLLRCLLEATSALAWLALRPSTAALARGAVSALARALYFLGVPAWLLLRVLA